MSKLLYIHPELSRDGDELIDYWRERSERRAAVAEGLGFDVVKLADVQLSPIDEQQQTALVTGEDFVGVWIDMNPNRSSMTSKKLVTAAGDAGKRLMGEAPDRDLLNSISLFLGLPKRETEN